MVRKKTEGSEEERRAAARKARRAGEAPAARQVTTGGSKQPGRPSHKGSGGHEEHIAALHRGKQQWRAGDLAGEELRDPAATGPERTFTDRGRRGFTARHEQVFQALTAAQAENGGEAVHLDPVARRAGLSPEETRALLHDLMRVHRLVSELVAVDHPDLGSRFEAEPRL